MSFNRLKYDEGQAVKQLNESMGPGQYKLYTPVQCGECLQANPWVQAQRGGVSQNSGLDRRFYTGPVDVESDLWNINRPASKIPSDQYKPICPNCGCDNQGEPCGQGNVVGCKQCGTTLVGFASGMKKGGRCTDANLIDFPTCYLPSEDTRLTNPASNLRESSVNRFEPLCKDPQKNVFFPGIMMIPTRTVMKDNHRPCVPVPAVNSMLPPKRDLPCIPTVPTCSAYTGPMYQFGKCG
jgi:hypothetical protein